MSKLRHLNSQCHAIAKVSELYKKPELFLLIRASYVFRPRVLTIERGLLKLHWQGIYIKAEG